MSLFLSAVVSTSESEPARSSLVSEAHIKIFRLGMFAMFNDYPTLAERQHIRDCAKCGEAFRLAVGVTDFTGPLDEPRDTLTSSSVRERTNDHRAA